MAIDVSTLNPQQRQAVVSILGPVLILAGAGSGKTRVLTHKIAHLIESGAYPPTILAVTFTNKAAREMSERLEQLLGQRMQDLGLWVGTFHSICGRILRREILSYQDASGRTWTNNFVIYDETNSVAAVKEAIKALNLDEKLYNPKTIRYQISGLKNELLTAYDYASQATDFRTEQLSRIYDAYEAILAQNNALDFDDLLLKTVVLLQKQPHIRDRYHQQFKHLLVDEFQDTNDTQYELVRLIAENVLTQERSLVDHPTLWQTRSFTVVGDVDQSIYSWRGANFRIILNFQRDFPATQLIKLEENYRSTDNILQLANAIIENNDQRLPKVLRSVKGQGKPIQCYEAQDDRDEALFIINRLLDKVNQEGYRPGQCCVLYRTNAQSRAFEDVLMSKGLAYTVVGGTKFYERREIRDILAYLTVVFNPADAYSVKRIINVPKRSIGKTSLEKLELFAQSEGMTLYEALQRVDSVPGVSAKTASAIKGFISTIQTFREQVDQMALDEWILLVCEQSGYLEALKETDPLDNEGRIQNVEEFITVAKQYLLDYPEGDLGGFLTQMSLLTDIDSAEEESSRFVLMTMHAAKGLEFPVVAIGGLEEGLFPHSRSNTDNDQLEEERRLMYVGVTRAEDQLILTYARRRMVFGELRYAVPSRFLKEAPQALLTGLYSLDQESWRDENARLYQRPKLGGGQRDWDVDDDPETREERPRFNASGKPPGRRSPSGYSDRGIDREAYGVKARKGANAHYASQQKSSTPAIPSGIKLLTVGTRVAHDKFGAGTIEQILGEGAKAIYSIQFEGIKGKKLLDPQVAKLKPL